MKIFRVCPSLMGDLLQRIRSRNKLDNLKFNDLMSFYRKENVILPGDWSDEMSKHGHDVFEILYNDINSQSKWMFENHPKELLSILNSRKGDIFFEIFLKQLEDEKPDILFLYAGGNNFFENRYKRKIKNLYANLKFVTYWGDELPRNKTYASEFSGNYINFTSSNKYTDKFKRSGLDAFTIGNCFNPSIKPIPRERNDFIFCGTTGYGFWDHKKRYEILVDLLQKTNLKAWINNENLFINQRISIRFLRFFFEMLQPLPADNVRSILSRYSITLADYFWLSKVMGINKGLFLGNLKYTDSHYFLNKWPIKIKFPFRTKRLLDNTSDYYGLLQSAKIVLNIHRDEDADVGNIRCFEATGLGSCLLTDHGEDLSEFFDTDNEIVTFTSSAECVEKLTYLNNNPKVLKTISENGRKRTLRDHTTKDRVGKINDILKGKSLKRTSGYKITLGESKRLVATYDLNVYPISYDFMFFLQAVHIKSQQENCNEVIVEILWAYDFENLDGVSKDAQDFYKKGLRSRVSNIMLQIADKFPHFNFINSKHKKLVTTFENDYLYPEKNNTHHNEFYRLVNSNPNKLLNIESSEFAKNYLSKKVSLNERRKLITVTIRKGVDKVRDTNNDEWEAFLNSLDEDKYKIIIIPDTDNIEITLKNKYGKPYESFVEASLNFDFRLAIYEKAYLNLCVNNGPCIAATFDKEFHFLMFKIESPDVPHTSIEFIKDAGFTPFEDPVYHNQFQKWVWHDDERKIIKNEFNKFCMLKEKISLNQ